MADYNFSKTERLQLTSHDVLGASSRYNANLEEVSLEQEPAHIQSVFPASTEPLEEKPETRTDKVLLLLFGITTHDLHGLGKILIACGSVSGIILIGLIIHIIWGPPQVAPHGAVATDVPACSEIGLNILKKGGTAVDAAIAALFCLGVVNPQSAGIGGGGFALVYDHKGNKTYYVDFREIAPAAFTSGMMETLKANPVLSIGVPGELKGLHDVHKVHGKIGWPDLVLPAVKVARDGFLVTSALEKDLWRFEKIRNLTSSQRLKDFLFPAGVALKAGQLITRYDLAATLEKIAYGGAQEFYTGHLSKEIIEEVKKQGGILSAEDLDKYNVSVREPLSTTFKGFRVVTAPPPSTGASLLMALNVLEGYNLTKGDINTDLFWHRFIEVSKFSFADGNRLGDPKFEPAVDILSKNFTTKEYANSIRSRIKDDTVLEHYGHDVNQPDPYGTTHVSVVDTNELYVSITSTLNNYFGSGVMTAGGVILNDEMNDFAGSDFAHEEQANSPVPGKRPLSHMVPTIVYHPIRSCINRIAVGASNGTHIPGGVLNTLLNILVFGMNVTDAIEYPRVFADKPENPVIVEASFNAKIVSELSKKRHNITVVTDGLSVVQAVMRNNKTITAHSDSRKGGAAAIY
ncbi:Gamma-glutamyltranspeptidase 1 [Hypsibius exemplaris]|uniref:Gamma-glutamyltranspeptidase 1 n=1 Tax=Hypsibius exemplaris TaxID=2072580 RepID=A0A1W0WF26_HYPEX|nr:Gamma-glutamyltranspeptidase 1 [Hypsibius exemplaris]